MALSLTQFIQQLCASGLMSEKDIRTWLEKVRAEDKPTTGEQLARLLVHEHQLTAFQVEQIASGKGQSLVLGNYVVLDKLGKGGMGMVLKAEHRRMKRQVALKILSPNIIDTPDALRRFQREVEAAAKLEHPNIVTAYDADEARGRHFLVMQYVEGTDLSALVRRQGPLQTERALSCVIQAARGLEYAHARGVIHRDIKPSNMLIDQEGTVRILDMGLARVDTENPDDEQLTSTGQIMGTVDYMAPEQAMDTHSADARADIYSLGMTLWYLLTGKPAYGGNTIIKKLMAHQNHPIPSLQEACPQVSPELDTVFQRMVAKKPDQRYQTMTEVIAALESCMHGATPIGASPTSGTPGENTWLSEFLQGLDPASTPTMLTRKSAAATSEEELDRTVTVQSHEIDTDPYTQRTILESEVDRRTQRRQRTRSSNHWWNNRTLLIAGGAALLLLIGAIFLKNLDPAHNTGIPESNTDGKSAPLTSTPNQSRDGHENPNAELSRNNQQTEIEEMGNDGEMISPPLISALSFDGIDDFVELPEIDYQEHSGVTFEAWVILSPRQRLPVIIHQDPFKLRFFQEGQQWMFIAYTPGEPILITHDHPLVTYGRVHVAGVFEPKSSRLYIDGRLSAQSANPNNLKLLKPQNHIGFLGAEKTRKGEEFFCGVMDEFRISFSARYQENFTPQDELSTDKDTALLYHFDEGKGSSVLRDSSGHGRDGKINGASWMAIPPPPR